MRLAIAQLNPTIGDLEANARRIADAAGRAAAQGADLLAVPNRATSASPPRDLSPHAGFVGPGEAAARHAAAQAPASLTIIIGSPRRLPGGGIANALFVFRAGQLLAT